MNKDNKINESLDTLQVLASECPSQQAENFTFDFLLQILNVTEDPIFVKDRQHRWILLNDAFASFMGCGSSSELIGKSADDFFPPTQAKALWEQDELVFTTGITNENEEYFTDVQGLSRYISTKKCLLEDSQGHQFLVGTIRDTTQKKLIEAKDITKYQLTEQALQKSEAKLQKLSANIPGMLYQFMLSPDGSVSFPYVNSRSYELYELTPEEIQNDASLILSIVHPDDRQQFEQSIAISAKTLQPWQWEGRIVLPGGQVKWLQGTSRPELQADGSIIWDGIITDINQRKLVEEALQQAYTELETRIAERTKELQGEIAERHQKEAELKTSEQRLALLIQQTPVGIVIWNTKWEIQEWNPAAEKIFGYSRSEVLNRHFGFLVPEIAREYVDQAMDALLHLQGETVSINENVTKDHQTIICEWYNNPLVVENGEVISIASMVLDITGRKQAEIQLQQQTKNLETALQELQQTQMQLVQSEKMSGLGQLVAGVAHEINNPVNFIYGNLTHANDYAQDLLQLVQLYQQYYPDTIQPIQEFTEEIDLEFLIQDLPQLLNSMKVGSQRIREIVLSLRTFSRMDEAEMKDVDIHEGIDSTLMILEHRIKAKPNHEGIKVIKEYCNLPLVECYPGQLNQVFMNILANAIDALEESVVKGKQTNNPQICIRTQLLELNQVTIGIADNGMGISEEVQQRLFDPFFTTKPIGKGTGMGLSISYQIISQKHSGTLECISQLGGGTEFLITIPLKQK
ncbi:MAG: PAS domain S-box protein [Goleter apudmare HA4340-LM2]|jgi:PAS domain S-box-containing protein|nr:PAS domain S-box protein [Goleter apudmare HA4340-LM2]